MDKKLLTVVTLLAVSATTSSAYAFNAGDVLPFDPGVTTTSTYGTTEVNSGSYFAMDYNGDGQFTANERTAISEGPAGGIVIGQLQPASGSHPGCPNGSESPGPDAPWCFFGSTGMSQVTGTPITDNGDGTLNFKGWGVTWNGIPNINLGGDASQGDTSKATITCTHNPCQAGDDYTLNYTAHVPMSDPSGFGGVYYKLHLEYTGGASIALHVVGGATQECSATGGSNITIDATTSVPAGDSLSSIAWSVDGKTVTGNNSISDFLSLGSHTISATLTTSDGHVATDSTQVEVQDTKPPVLTLGFTDSRTGDPVTSISSANVQFVGISMVAKDVCDASPVTKGSLTPVMEVNSGDIVKVFGNTGNVQLPVSAIKLSASASDASGNQTYGQAILPVQ